MLYVAAFLSLFAVLISEPAFAQYTIKRENDAPFTFTVLGSVTSNKGSSLQRETIVLNDPKAPIEILSAKLKWEFARSTFTFNIDTEITAKKNVSAVSIRHIVYDVFGQHMRNLANLEPKDIGANQKLRMSGTWNARGNDTSETLTIVTYVSRIRLTDGTQWIYDEKGLVTALGSLKLEQRVGENDKPASP